MENLQRIRLYVIAFTTVAVIHSVASQRQLSGGNPAYSQSPYSQPQPQPPQVEECGRQDKDQLPDHHAAAPWAAALFYVEGDFFFQNITPQYLSTAILVSRNLAITSGSKILAQQQPGLQTKLQLYYGHRASGKHTLIRIRKVEALSPPRQPLALKLDSSSSRNQQQNGKSGDATDLYLLHLESVYDITSFSRPLCLNENVFQYWRNQYSREIGTNNKLHISGYATKNETSGPHVVYFSGDREWRVQSWDTDSINVIMREQQVTYDFLPRHFNQGSALTVKMNDQFFLVGLLIRSSGSQTMFRSLEKFVELIKYKEMEYGPKPPVSVGLQSPFDTSVSGSGNSNNGNSGSDGYGVQQQNPVNDQLKHLEQIEYEEKLSRNPSYDGSKSQQSQGSSSGGNVGANWGSRSTPRPDNIPAPTRPSLLTPRPDSYYTQQQPQQTQHYNPISNPVQSSDNDRRQQESSLYQRQPDTQFIYPSYTSTTTSRSQFPPYIQHNDGQRQSLAQNQNDQRQTHQQQPQQRYQPQYPKCSHDYVDGVDIECLSRLKGVSREDCIKSAPVNTTIRLSCKNHYVPLDGDKIIEKTCDTSGNWLPRKPFACKLECGTVDQSVPYIVNGLKTASEKWPWHAALFKRVNQTSYTYICGATLITRSILITAAHCVHHAVDGVVDKSLYKVVVGAISSDLLSNRKDPQAQEFDLKVIKKNEHYNPRNFEADIALIQIDKPVLLTEYVRPVCFPFPSDENKLVSSYQLSEGNSGVVVGFGTTNDNWSISRTLRMATLPVVSVKNCTNVLERQPSSTQYCAGYTNGTSVCEGDSGGAQIFNSQFSKKYYIQGIISHGNRKESTIGQSRCDHEKYTVFTRVISFAEWVKEVVYDLEFDYNRRRRRRK